MGALFVALLALVWASVPAQGQTVRIRYRPLTPQEIKNAGLTNTTQKSGGGYNPGIGQPIYMEALVQTGTVVTAVNWTLIQKSTNSTLGSVIPSGPLSNAVPTYDGGDRAGLFVAGRAMFVPDVKGTLFNGDFLIKTDVVLTNKTLSYTNIAYGSVYVGQKFYLCLLCHADKQSNFNATAHATAFKKAINGESTDHFSANCISCHSLGYDTTPGATNGGFDDVAASLSWTFPATISPTNWDNMPTNLQNVANVQCENCHGPADRHLRGIAGIPPEEKNETNVAIDVSLSAGTCGQCHDSLPQHVKTYEWFRGLHATGFVFRFSGSCQPCHSAKGFIETWDPYYSMSTSRIPRSTEQEGIACATCHDPHSTGMGDKQLRNITTATLSNGFVVTEAMAGTGVLCMNCHHARQEANSTVLGSGSVGPHHSTQGDLLLGTNAFTYGLNMPSSRHLQAVTNSCVGCHMQLIAKTSFSNSNTKVGGHTFKIAWDNDTVDPSDDIKVTEVCKNCHVGLYNDFDVKGSDYDRDGVINGVQTEIQGLLNQLGKLLPPLGSTQVTYSASYTPAQRKGCFNWFYVWEDKSLGIHNPKYAAAILQASIDDLQGGIDVDRDGLTDSWEMANFGSLTAQSGNDDADGDGLSNKMEMQLGTNPNLVDTDSDGFSDQAEVQAGSDPLNASSVPSANTVGVLPALELSFLPLTPGQTQLFQVVDAMGNGGGWTNAGSTFVSSNAFSYQLISLRDSTQKYYRVIKP